MRRPFAPTIRLTESLQSHSLRPSVGRGAPQDHNQSIVLHKFARVSSRMVTSLWRRMSDAPHRLSAPRDANQDSLLPRRRPSVLQRQAPESRVNLARWLAIEGLPVAGLPQSFVISTLLTRHTPESRVNLARWLAIESRPVTGLPQYFVISTLLTRHTPESRGNLARWLAIRRLPSLCPTNLSSFTNLPGFPRRWSLHSWRLISDAAIAYPLLATPIKTACCQDDDGRCQSPPSMLPVSCPSQIYRRSQI
jgi:hypothetical protein